MLLISPRFVNNRRLRQIGHGTTVLRHGSRGRSVHLVQQALIDSGLSIGVADGLFGDRTQRGLRRFQHDNTIPVTGVLDERTLGKLDRAFRRYQGRVRLHFRSINLTNVPFEVILSSTRLVYQQYGIKIETGSAQSLWLTPQQQQIFNVVNESCSWTINSGEAFRLHGLGGSVPSNEILVYYINRFSKNNLLGCGGHATGRPAVTVVARASRWDTAHEIGHVLLTSSYSPVHHSSTRNLMYAFSTTNSGTPFLTSSQLRQIRQSTCCMPF